MAELLPLGLTDTQRAGAEAARQWNDFNMTQANIARSNSLTTGQDIQNKTMQQKQDEEAAAVAAFNKAWTPAGTPPGGQIPGGRMNGTWNNNGQPVTPIQPATPTALASLAAGQGPLNNATAANQAQPIIPQGTANAAPTYSAAPSLGSLSPFSQASPAASTPAASTPAAPSLSSVGMAPSKPATLGPLANIMKNNEEPYPNVADHPVAQALYSMGNKADTTSSVADEAMHSPLQVTPQGTLDRQAFYQSLADQGHANLIPDFQDRFTKADQQAQLFKEAEAIKAHATLAAGFAAFKSLPDDMKPSFYQQEVAGLKAQGVDTSSFPATYDPTNKANVAFVDGLAAQATSALDKLKDQHETSTENINSYNAETARMNQAGEMTDYQKAMLKLQWAKLKQGEATGDYDPVLLAKVATGQTIIPRGKGAQAIIEAASTMFPGTDMAAAQKFTSDLGKVAAGTSGGVAVGSNKTLEHLGTMMDLDAGGAGLNFGPNWADAAFNASKNSLTGNNNKAAWDAAHDALSNEMARSFKGGPPAESEAVRAMKNLSFSDSPDRKATVYKTYADLLQGQTGAVETQRAQVYGPLDPGTSLLTTRSQGVIQKLNGGKLPPGMLPPWDATRPGQGNAVTPTAKTGSSLPPTMVQNGKTGYYWKRDNSYHTSGPEPTNQYKQIRQTVSLLLFGEFAELFLQKEIFLNEFFYKLF